jgi:uroporphyrinogen decarboxylase
MNEKIYFPEERIVAAISHKKSDRISCAPLIESYASRFAGITNHDFFYDKEKAFSAFGSIEKKFPIWDIQRSIYFIHYGSFQDKIGLLKCKMPGIELPPNYEYQIVEYEAMSRADYQIILNKGYKEYIAAFFSKAYDTSKEEIAQVEQEMLELHCQEIENARSQNQAFLYGAHIYFPVSYFSNLRSFPEFIRDMYKFPELLCEVISIATDEAIKECIEIVAKTGIPRAFIGINRISSQFFSFAAFEKFVWPFIDRFVYKLIEQDITPILHLDSDWTKNLHYFESLPKNKIIIELDGSTDIFQAKKVLNSRICLLGDVPASLFVLGTPHEIEQYCYKLLSEIGYDGGFILGSGCTLPHNARHENVEAFFNSLTQYQNL